MNLEKLINTSPYTYFFLVVDPFLDIQIYPHLKNFHLIYAFQNPKLTTLVKNKIPFFCLEQHGAKLPVKNSGLLLSHPLVIDYIKSHTVNQTAIIPFKPSGKIDFICKKKQLASHFQSRQNQPIIRRQT